MNYIKQLQADKAEALDSARSVEAAINGLISYLSCPKFHVDTRVQVGDVLRDLLPFVMMLHIWQQPSLREALTKKRFKLSYCCLCYM